MIKLKSNIIYTIGHSNLSVLNFIKILKHYKIKCLIDIRSIPGSKKYPHFNKENLMLVLTKNKILYCHLPLLGGFKNKTKNIDFNLNGFWKNQNFHNYADYALSNEFKIGLSQLIKISEKYQTAIMCAEVLWWRCHRRIITDYLLINNKNVYHIFDVNKKELSKRTINSKKIQDNIIYPKNNEK